MSVFRGISTVGNNKPPYSLTDTDLIRQDLLNHFNTKRGERYMLPDFGTDIHEILMDPLDSFSKDKIKEEVKRVINSDPRVRLYGVIQVIEMNNGVRVEAPVQYVIYDTAETLYLQFDSYLKK